MTYSSKVGLIILVIIVALLSCTKDSKSDKKSSPLNVSSTNVQRGEPLLASTNLAGNVLTKWAVYPSTNATLIPANNQAEALFAYAGTYRITASYFTASDTTIAYDSSSAQIDVNDTIYAPRPDGRDSVGLVGDEIVLVPISATDSGLVLMAKTKGLYSCTPYLTGFGWTDGPNMDIDFNGAQVVERKTDCMGAQNPAISYLFFTPIPPGTYTITAHLNFTDYQGTLTVNNTYYLFNWNYSNGVTISPTILKKQ
jgi:hypothetical protein